MLKISQNNDNRGRHLEFYSHTGIGTGFSASQFGQFGLNLNSGAGAGAGPGFQLFHTPMQRPHDSEI